MEYERKLCPICDEGLVLYDRGSSIKTERPDTEENSLAQEINKKLRELTEVCAGHVRRNKEVRKSIRALRSEMKRIFEYVVVPSSEEYRQWTIRGRPYIDSAGMIARRKALVREIKDRLAELEIINRAIGLQTKTTASTGYEMTTFREPGPLERLLHKRAWKRILRDYRIPFTDFIGGKK